MNSNLELSDYSI